MKSNVSQKQSDHQVDKAFEYKPESFISKDNLSVKPNQSNQNEQVDKTIRLHQLPNSHTCDKGFIDLQKLYYCAQKNFIELYVLGIGEDDVQESLSAKAVSLIAQGKRSHSDPAKTNSEKKALLKQSTLLQKNDGRLINTEIEQQPPEAKCRYEDMIEMYNSNLFVFDPNVKAMGDSQLGYIGSMLFFDTLDSMMD